MGFESDESLATELELFAENDGDLYRSMTEGILKNLATKKAQGKYDSEKAVQAFMYLAEAGAKEYIRQHGSPGDIWHAMFPIGVRRMAATKWRDEFEEEFRLGNYDHLVPKKYQAAPRKKPRTCPDCHGSGSRSTARSASGRELARHEKHGTRCPRCGGAGTLS
jgi:hypothetical protein